MKLQADSKKELTHIACGTCLLTVVMFVIFAALHLVKWAPFDYTVILGAVIGTCVAIGNFWGICIMVQKATAEPDEKRRKMMIQVSYHRRTLLQAAWVVIAIVAPCFHFAAGIAPLLFPRITIYYLQITGRYQKPQPKGEDVSVEETAEPEAADKASSGDEGGES